MFKKLRNRIVLIASASIFVLLALILGIINVANFSEIARQGDEILNILARSGGDFDLPPASNSETATIFKVNEPPTFNPDDQDTRESTRYFTVKYDRDWKFVSLNRALERFTEQDCIAWADSLKNGQRGWTKINYRYLTYEYENYHMVSVIDLTRELTPSYRILWSSLIGSIIGLIIVSLTLYFVSDKLLHPLEEVDYKQKVFIADAAKTLKTPATIIALEASSLAKIDNNEHVKNIEKQADKLIDLSKKLNDLVLFTSEDAVLTDINLSLTLEDVIDNYEDTFKVNKKDLNLDIDKDVILNGDEGMIRKMFTEIIENALKFTKSECFISLKKIDERITFEAKNDNPNIVDGDLDSVFNRFYKSEVEGKDGPGIGLSIVKEIATNHKARISAKGKDGYFILKIEF